MTLDGRNTAYEAGQDHLGQWWIIAPNGLTGYEVAPAVGGTATEAMASIMVKGLNWGDCTPGKLGLDSADPPPELVGGVPVAESAPYDATKAMADLLSLREWWTWEQIARDWTGYAHRGARAIAALVTRGQVVEVRTVYDGTTKRYALRSTFEHAAAAERFGDMYTELRHDDPRATAMRDEAAPYVRGMLELLKGMQS